MALKYRPISQEQIARLTAQNCSCDNWSKVRVADGFDTGRIKSTYFAGDITLGVFDGESSFWGGIKKPTGISNATIVNCSIGDNVYINQVKNHIANYIIEDNVIIENVALIAVEGETSFGNGIKARVINEAEGREIPIYDNLSAQIAYIMAVFRHRPGMIGNLQRMIADYVDSVTSSMGLLGQGTKIINSRTVKNIKTGPQTFIEGAMKLENGTLNSSPDDPAYIGHGVIAENFIAACGAKITDGAMISNCFVGQGCILGKQFSAEHSVFFANCEGLGGEACSIFAGPYTVTHHKATLLIAGLFSFFNAGSGSNQSNHMYKLGPVHQGVLERGCKTASDSYIAWPARLGPFTTVVGSHYNHPDTGQLPFSYLIENNNESVLIPAVNLAKVGTIRDGDKWTKRDKRKTLPKTDRINLRVVNSYIAEKMTTAIKILEKLRTTIDETTDYVTWQNTKINKSSLSKGIELYNMGVDKFLGDLLINRLGQQQLRSNEQIWQILSADAKIGSGKWVDLAGLLVPEQIAQKLLMDIEKATIGSLEEIEQAFDAMSNNHNRYQWSWATKVLQKRLGKPTEQLNASDLIDFIKRWNTAVTILTGMILKDAKKEFSGKAQIGFGLNGNEETRQRDFEQVRGKFQDNNFVNKIREQAAKAAKLADELINQLEKVG